MITKTYNLNEYKEVINCANKEIQDHALSLNSLHHKTGISRQTLRRVLHLEGSRTKVNPIELLKAVMALVNDHKITILAFNESEIIRKKVDLKNYFPNLIERDSRYLKIILYFISILKEIKEYEGFFTDLFYLIDPDKKKRFNFVIQLLLDNEILELKANNTIKQGKNYFISSLKHRTKVYNLNIAARYFEKNDRFKEAFICYRFLGNNRKREANLMEHITDIYFSNTPHLCPELFNSYFIWLKKTNRRKSNEFKIFYISVLINYFSNRSMISNAFMYSLYLIKYIKIKDHILSIECNKNFTFDTVYALDTESQCKYKSVSHFVNSALLNFISLYFDFSMYDFAFKLNRFVLSKLPEKDVHYPYFSNLEFLFICKFGDLKKLKKHISELEYVNCSYKANTLFKMKHLYYGLSSDVSQLLELQKEFLQNFNPENYHYNSIKNIYENYIIYFTVQKKFENSIAFCFTFMFYKKKKNIYESLLYFLQIFIQLIKNHQRALFSVQLKKIYKILYNDPFGKVFGIPEKDNLNDQITSFFPFSNPMNKKNISAFDEFTIKEFYLVFFKRIKDIFVHLKKEFLEQQILFVKKKRDLVNKMKKQLIGDGYLKGESNRQQDIITTFIARYPEDNKILQFFLQENENEDVYSYYVFIQEFNFLEYFLDGMLKEYFMYENRQIIGKSPNISFFENISENLINQILVSKFDFNTYVSSYFENYLVNLEEERKSILNEIDKDESLQKVNLTNKLLSFFDNDVDEKFLEFTKAYILAKY